ncbi:YLS3-like protein [Tanacetum coccineum]
MGSRALLIWVAIVMVLVSFSKGDFDQDKQQCGETLIGLSVCLPYVSGQAKAPTPACCTALKPVVEKNHVCLCILVKDRNDPGLNLKINATLALGLPDVCHTPSNATECPKLMNLPPNSPDAKVFEDFGKSNHTASLGNIYFLSERSILDNHIIHIFS